jgi:hypothetical protein
VDVFVPHLGGILDWLTKAEICDLGRKWMDGPAPQGENERANDDTSVLCHESSLLMNMQNNPALRLALRFS